MKFRDYPWRVAYLVVLLIGRVTLAENQPPNIVFVFSDDHAVQAISACGSRINQTPQIDRLARQGVLFANSFCANSICGPSRASILTGKHSHQNGFFRNGNQFDGSQTTFPPLLQRAGYQTALIGKWHLGTQPVGFDHWEILPGQGHYYNPDFLQMDGSKKRRDGYCTDIVTDLALTWLREQRDPKRPFLLMCQHKAPHRTWAPALRHLELYPDDIPEPATLRDDYAGRSTLLAENEMSIRNHMYWGWDMKFRGDNLFPDHFQGDLSDAEYDRMTDAQRQAWDAHFGPENRAFIDRMRSGEMSDDQILSWKYQRYIKNYLRCVAAVDESVGRLMDYLDDAGLTENTLFIYSSDQGFYLGEHGWYDKRWMFEESLRMPFIARWPKMIPADVQADALIQNIDYAPTFLEVAQAEVPAEMQGRSLVDIFENQCATPSDWRDAIYYAYYENAAVHNAPVHDGVRTNRFKLIFFPRTREWNLFDLDSDPQELKSVHDQPDYAAIFAGMQKRYRDLRRYYEVNSATIPATRADEAWWRERFQAQTKQNGEAPIDLVFIGDSITQGWETKGKAVWEKYYGHRRALNLGFSGDRTEHVIWRAQHGRLDRIQPKVAVLMIGTNNTGHLLQEPSEVAAGVKRILAELEKSWPRTQIVLHGVFPRGRTPYELERLNNLAINQIIRDLADETRVHYLDIGDAFLEPDDTISADVMPDGLHLSEGGYERWAQRLEPELKDLGL
jgi:N-acetylglucosamine-6-sulfatase